VEEESSGSGSERGMEQVAWRRGSRRRLARGGQAARAMAVQVVQCMVARSLRLDGCIHEVGCAAGVKWRRWRGVWAATLGNMGRRSGGAVV